VLGDKIPLLLKSLLR